MSPSLEEAKITYEKIKAKEENDPSHRDKGYLVLRMPAASLLSADAIIKSEDPPEPPRHIYNCAWDRAPRNAQGGGARAELAGIRVLSLNFS